MNKMIFAGKIMTEVEVKDLASGDKVIKFSIPVERWTKPGAEKVTDWHNFEKYVKAGGKLQDFVVKGAVVSGTASVEYNEYNGKTYTNMKVDQINIVHFAEDGSAVKKIVDSTPENPEMDMDMFKDL